MTERAFHCCLPISRALLRLRSAVQIPVSREVWVGRVLFIVECVKSPVKTLRHPLSISLSPFYDHTIPLIFDDVQVILVVHVPSGVLSSSSHNILDFYPVSRSFLDETVARFHMGFSTPQLFIAAAFKLSLHRQFDRSITTVLPSFERSFHVPLVVEFRNIPASLEASRWCVGQLTTTGWTCVSSLRQQRTDE